MREKHLINITKLSAATTQVRTAIILYFSNGDPVSIHTLLYAAHDLIHGMCRYKKLPTLMINNDAVTALQIAPLIHRFPNFFKHARRPGEDDPDRSIQFPAMANLIFFSACITGLDRIGVKRTFLEEALAFYLLLHEPDFFSPDELKKRPTGKTLSQLRRVKRERFLDLYVKSQRRN